MTFVTTARLTSALNCSESVGEMVESAIAVCTTPMMSMPATGAPRRFSFEKMLGNRRSVAADLAVCAMVNCQPSSEPRQAITASAMMIEPTIGLNILAYASANGPVDLASSSFGTMPWMTVVESTYTTAAASVPNMQASGTSRLGFSTASEFCAADSMPRNAHSVSAMLEPMPSSTFMFCGFQACMKVSPLNQNQPMMERPATGTITPHTVTAPNLPVMEGPPKLATVVSQMSAITLTQVAIGVADIPGKKPAREPTAQMAMATLPT